MISLVLLSGASQSRAGRPNVILLVSDDQRPDTIAALGNPQIKTPHLDHLVAEGSSMRRAVSPSPICTPARAEILTGCSGFTNRTYDFGKPILPKLTTLPQAFGKAGYHTCYVGKWHNNGKPRDHGYAETRGWYGGGGGRWAKPYTDHLGVAVSGYRGWVFKKDDGTLEPDRGVGLTAEISAQFADAAIGFIEEEQDDRPFFLHVNFTAPHDPLLLPPGYEKLYDPEKLEVPPNFAERHPFDHGNFEGRDERLLPWPRTPSVVKKDLAAYYAVISHLDEQVGRIMESIRKTDGAEQKSIVVFTSDHGLAMGSHGLRGKQNMYEHTVGVPMVLWGAGVPKDQKFDAQVYLRDLYPTLCQLSGVEIPETVEAKSFAPVLRGEEREVHSHVFGYFRNVQRMIRTDRWKLIHYSEAERWQLFDLKTDPHEITNLVDEDSAQQVLKQLRDRLETSLRDAGDPLSKTSKRL